MRNRHLLLLLGLSCLSPCLAGFDIAAAQEEGGTVTCPPNSHWSGQGSSCDCDAGFVAPRGENRCVPESQACAQYGPAHLVGSDCVCNEGYVIPAGGSRCEPAAEAAASCPPNSHRQGDSCFCDEGYGNIDGRCVSLAAACAKFNARWSPAKGDCECPPGFHEDTAGNTCVPYAPPAKTARREPAPGQGTATAPPPAPAGPSVSPPERNNGLARDIRPETTPGSQPVAGDSGRAGAAPQAGAAADALPENPPPGPPAGENRRPPGPPPAATATPRAGNPADWWGTAEPVAPPETGGGQDAGTDMAATRSVAPRADGQFPSVRGNASPDQGGPSGNSPGEQPPQPDFYQHLDGAGAPVLEKALAQSLDEAAPDLRQEMAQQLQTLGDFNASGVQEVSLPGKGVIETAKQAYVLQEYSREVLQWQQEVRVAEDAGKVKAGVDAKTYLAKAEDEKRLRAQIAALGQTIGFNHLRLVEAAGALKYEAMPSEYRAHFTKSAADDFNAVAEGTESEKAFRNIAAMNKQAKELKEELKRKYPPGWQDSYLDLPEKPRLEALQKKVDTNIFILFDRQGAQ